MQQEVRNNNNFSAQLLPLLEDNGIKIKFSAVNKSRRNDVPKHVKRILEEGDKVIHFIVVHNWISDEARRNWLSPPEKCNPPQKRETEREWSSGWSERNPATFVQYWIPNDDFLLSLDRKE